MKKALIVAGIVVAVVVVVGGILVANLDRIIESQRETILAQAREQVGRDIQVGEIGVALWPGLGVSLEDVVLADDPAYSSEAFVTVADLRVNLRLLPLLRKQVDVKRLVLRGPRINVIRGDDGGFNFDSLSKGGDDADAASSTALVLAFADIEDGEVRYVDRAGGVDRTVRDIDFSARNVGFDREVTFELSAAVMSEETDVRVSGALGPVGPVVEPPDAADAPVRIEFEIGPVAGDALRGLAPNDTLADQIESIQLGSLHAKGVVEGTAGALRAQGIELRAAILGAGEDNATATIDAGPFNAVVEGGPDPAAIDINARFSVAPISLASAAALAPAGLPEGVSVGGTAGVSGTATGRTGAMAFEVSLDADAAEIRSGDAFAKAAGVALQADIEGTARETETEIAAFEARIGDIRATGSGTVRTGDTPGFSINARADGVDIAGLEAFAPALAASNPSGKMSLDVRVSGVPGAEAPPDVEGTITVEDVGLRLEQLPNPVTGARARVTMSGTKAKVENASFKIGESSFTMAADATSLTPLAATYRVTSPRVRRGDVQKLTVKTANPEVLEDVVVQGRAQAEGDSLRVQAEIRSAKGMVSDLAYTNLNAAVRTRGPAVVIEQFAANTLDGKVSGSGTVYPAEVPPRFDIRTRADAIDLARYFAVKFPDLAGVVQGTMDMSVSVRGSGTEWEQVAQTLAGDGTATIVRGALLNVNLANELFAGIESIPLVSDQFLERMRQRRPQLFQENRTLFENLKGALTFENGRINASGLALNAADFTISGDGWISFDRKMNLSATVVLSDALTGDVVKELAVAKNLRNARGRIEIPLRFSGSVLKPTVVPDTNALGDRLRDSMVDEGKDRIKDRVKDLLGGFGKKETAPADTTRKP